MTVREAKKFVAANPTDGELLTEYRYWRSREKHANLSKSLAISRVADALSAELRRRGLAVPKC